ncbi:ribonuclease P protein component [Muriicola sp. Z0-33]|uniref:ribonuclease P protein component n=1 Tax=Muriicola sp. Z0-33 TaxID=2816957 RepID=UPI002237BB72|nr:ribonuclease P protein component [Muriicola sp. Z0-33]MCW5514697.1 ribonuclease P protein component [Muriicola sp. Z0-33]
MAFTFPKKEKLRNKRTIDRLFKEGQSVSVYPLKLIYLNITIPAEAKIQTAVAVPKSNFKSAVKRNRVKRLMRESYRQNKQYIFNNMEGNFAFLFLYLGKDMPTYAVVEKSMLTIFKKLVKRLSDEKVAE